MHFGSSRLLLGLPLLLDETMYILCLVLYLAALHRFLPHLSSTKVRQFTLTFLIQSLSPPKIFSITLLPVLGIVATGCLHGKGRNLEKFGLCWKENDCIKMLLWVRYSGNLLLWMLMGLQWLHSMLEIRHRIKPAFWSSWSDWRRKRHKKALADLVDLVFCSHEGVTWNQQSHSHYD